MPSIPSAVCMKKEAKLASVRAKIYIALLIENQNWSRSYVKDIVIEELDVKLASSRGEYEDNKDLSWNRPEKWAIPAEMGDLYT